MKFKWMYEHTKVDNGLVLSGFSKAQGMRTCLNRILKKVSSEIFTKPDTQKRRIVKTTSGAFLLFLCNQRYFYPLGRWLRSVWVRMRPGTLGLNVCNATNVTEDEIPFLYTCKGNKTINEKYSFI